METKVLRSKQGNHVYHIVGKKRGKLLVKNPADDLLPVEMTQEQVDAIAEPAWEWNDTIRETLEKAHVVLSNLVQVNTDFALAASRVSDCLGHINKLRNGEL